MFEHPVNTQSILSPLFLHAGSVRAQVAPAAYTPFMSKVGGGLDEAFVLGDPLRLMTQELAVDGLRYALNKHPPEPTRTFLFA